MTQTRRNFLKASAAFCVAPLGFSLKKTLPDSFGLVIIAMELELKKPLPDSFVLGRTCSCRDAFLILSETISRVNSKPYRGYPAMSVILQNGSYKRMEAEGYCQFRFERTEYPKWYRPVDFNLIDFGEEMPS